MRNTYSTLSFLLILLLFTSNSISGNVKIGLKIGTSSLKYNNSGRAYIHIGDYYKSISHKSTYVPKTISTYASFGLLEYFEIRGTLNFYRSLSNTKIDRPEKTIIYNNSEEIYYTKYYQETETSFEGYSSGIDFLYYYKFTGNSVFFIYTGIGIKYYDLKNDGDWSMISTANIDGETIQMSSNGKFNDVIFSGFGQELIFGFEFRPWKKVGVYLEFSKLGFTNINIEKRYDYVRFEETSDNNYKEVFREHIETSKKDFQSDSGLSDIGIFFGINVNIL